MKLIQGNCLEEESQIESGSVDLILTDLPYGTMNGANLDGWKGNKTSWDLAIEPIKIFNIANRILRKNGKMVLFSQEPYTSKLVTGAIPNVPFSYRMVWEKDHFANTLLSAKAPVSYFEDIVVFSKTYDFEGLHPLRCYFSIVFDYIGKTKKSIIDMIGQVADHVFRVNSSQFELCTEQTYNELIDVFGIDNMDGFKEYSELKKIDDSFKEEYASTFNLWEGNKYKSNILKYKKDYSGHHPTQKPVLLLEDLIKTFSNKDDLVVDLTMGSGSTGVACANLDRDFIGIELDKEYYVIAEKRITEAVNKRHEELF